MTYLYCSVHRVNVKFNFQNLSYFFRRVPLVMCMIMVFDGLEDLKAAFILIYILIIGF